MQQELAKSLTFETKLQLPYMIAAKTKVTGAVKYQGLLTLTYL
jgi:hypothetical protein